MARMKCILSVLMILIMVFLCPAARVLADETQGESNDRNDMPGLYYSRLDIEKKSFFDWFGLKDIPEENVIEKIVFTHRDIERFDYSLYDLVCDFEFKTLNDDGSITTSFYSETINFKFYILSNTLEYIFTTDFFDVVDNYYDVGTKEFIHQFNYKNLIKNADGFKERSIKGTLLDKTYNTVVSRVDFYFVRKSDGKRGIGRRFVFTWDSDFWKQLCTKVDFSFYSPDDGSVKDIDSVESEFGVDGFDTDPESASDNLFVKFLDYVLFLPEILYIVVSNVINFFTKFSDLMEMVFPFFPGWLFNVFGALIVFGLLIGLWKLIKGE